VWTAEEEVFEGAAGGEAEGEFVGGYGEGGGGLACCEVGSGGEGNWDERQE
jgi:hypothetical protein